MRLQQQIQDKRVLNRQRGAVTDFNFKSRLQHRVSLANQLPSVSGAAVKTDSYNKKSARRTYVMFENLMFILKKLLLPLWSIKIYYSLIFFLVDHQNFLSRDLLCPCGPLHISCKRILGASFFVGPSQFMM